MEEKIIKISRRIKLKVLSDGEFYTPVEIEEIGIKKQKVLTHDEMFEMAFDCIDNINKAIQEIVAAVTALQEEQKQ